ncbi:MULTISPECIES: hypothetical protein [Cloacibacterium]|uniref:hypothetical protein n=1 Tax=Cloacibacterium TaxID=501783 RepID=UPI001BCCEC60|nr:MULTISPECIES: hypothetical protein [Cloacibacterium]WDT69084.1 hypothetical protein N7277_05650 [Cloacibacterium sp. TD35]
MKQILIFLSLFLLNSLFGQKSQIEKNLEIQIHEFGSFNQKSDFKNSVNYLHQNVIKLYGGKENFIKNSLKSLEEYKKAGFFFDRFYYTDFSPILKYKGELQTAVVQNMVVKTKNGKFLSRNSIIAISNDGGRIWKFIGVTQENVDKIKKVLPNLSPSIKLINELPTKID